MQEKFSFNELPEAVAYLIDKVAELKTIVEKNKSSALPAKRETVGYRSGKPNDKKGKANHLRNGTQGNVARI